MSSLVGGRVLNKCAFYWFVLYDYITMYDAEILKKRSTGCKCTWAEAQNVALLVVFMEGFDHSSSFICPLSL